MEDCIFCKIVKGEIPSKRIYEDDQILVFMNINPSTNGHLLVIPKEHSINFLDTSNEIITHSLDIVREIIYPLLKEKLHCSGLTIAQNNELGQEIKHYHIHLTPRYEDDGLDISYDKEKIIDLDTIFEKLTK
ncbi:MAG: HIT domain-containing protein [Bacilli bacterium]|nr:HIT domain-containing protein [Bacilli bacterium]